MAVSTILFQAAALFLGLNLSLGVMELIGLKQAGFVRRVIIAYINLVACALFGASSAILLTIVGNKRLSQWVTARSFYYTMKLSTGVTFEIISGAEHLNTTRPAVLVGNHQSALDILMLAAVWPHYCSVTAKKQLKNMPFLGWFMSLSGTVFLDRANKASALKAFEGAAAEMQTHKQSVFIFPEGTRSGATEPMMLPFKKGAFHLAVQAKTPILPVVTCVYSGVFSTSKWTFRPGRIPIIGMYVRSDPDDFADVSTVLPPIPTENLDASDVDELTRFTRERMLSTLTKLTESKHGQQAVLADPPAAPKEPWFIAKPPNMPAEQQVTDGGAETVDVTGTDTGAARQR